MKTENIIQKTFMMVAVLLIVILALMIIFIVTESIPAFTSVGISEILFKTQWFPDANLYGLFPMTVATLCVSAIALVMATPLAIGCAIYMEEYSSNRVKNILKPVIQTLAGIPSVVYGFFGLMFIVPFIRQTLGGNGFSIISASIVLAVMILPTIITLSQDAIKTVPYSLKEASYGLGSARWQTIKNIILPHSLPGIMVAVILGLSRAVGETLAVLMIAGNVSHIPTSLTQPVRTLTSNIALEMGYATDIHYHALFATAVVLFSVIMVLMIVSNYVYGDADES